MASVRPGAANRPARAPRLRPGVTVESAPVPGVTARTSDVRTYSMPIEPPRRQGHQGRQRPASGALAGRCRAGEASGGGLRLPEDLVDLGDVVEQLLALGRVHAALAASGAGLLGRLVEQLVQLRVLLEIGRAHV